MNKKVRNAIDTLIITENNYKNIRNELFNEIENKAKTSQINMRIDFAKYQFYWAKLQRELILLGYEIKDRYHHGLWISWE